MPSRKLTPGAAEWIPVRELHIEDDLSPYQREEKTRWIASRTAAFDPELLGVLEVSKRADGLYVVKDGKQRTGLCRALGYSDETLLCHVMVHQSMAAEAANARGLNKYRTSWRSWNDFNAALIAGDPLAKGVDALVRSCGLRLVGGASAEELGKGGLVFCVTNVVGLYTRDGGPSLLKRVLTALKKGWDDQGYHGTGSGVGSFRAVLVQGCALFLANHYEYVDDDRLITALSRTSPDEVYEEADSMRQRSRRHALAVYAAAAIESKYNAGQRERGKLREGSLTELAGALHDYARRNRPTRTPEAQRR